jgi:hypothetical protein
VSAEKQKLTDLVNSKTSVVTDKLNKKDEILKSGQDQIQKALDDLKKKGQESLPVPVPANIPLPGAKQDESGGESKPALPEIKNPFKKKF